MSAPSYYDTKPFSRFEWMLSLRYLRARRKESFISVIAGFSLLGITLGVATLIIVMAVMNGFRSELLGKILGLNGHFIVQGIDSDFTDYDDVAKQISAISGVKQAFPYVEGQALASSQVNNFGVVVRGMRRSDLEAFSAVSSNLKQGSLDNFGDGGGVVIGIRLAEQLGLRVGDKITIISPQGGGHAVRHDAAHQGLRRRRHLRARHVGI